MAKISTGVKITVDTSDIESKFTKSVEALNASLTKSQKSMGLFYDETGLLTNALGQCVEGLSNSQIKLGQYVDELGRVHTVQGGYVDGLNRSQIAMGQFTDEAGNVYNKLGELIGQTEKAKQAAEKEAAAMEAAAQAQAMNAHAMADSFGKVADGVGKVAGQFATFSAILATNSKEAGDFRDKLARGLQGLATAAGTFKTSMDAVKGFTEARAVIFPALSSISTAATGAAATVTTLGTSATTAAPALAALGGPAGLAAAAIAAIGAGFVAFNSTKSKATEYSAEFTELAEKAKKAGVEIKSVADALQVGAFAAPADRLDEATEKMMKAKAELDAAVAQNKANAEAAAQAAKTGGMGAGGAAPVQTDTTELDAAYKDAIAEYNAEVAKYVDLAREEQKTEVDKLNELKKTYETLKEQAVELGNTDVVETFERQVELINGKIDKEKEKVAKEAEEQAKAEHDATLSSLGLSDYLNKAKDAAKNLDTVDAIVEQMKEWKKAVKNGEISTKEYADGVKEARQAAKEAAYKLAGLELPENTSDIKDALEELKKAYNAGALTQKEYNDAVRQAKDKQKADAEAEKAKNVQDVANSIGVTIRETSDAIGNYSESVKKLDGLLNSGAISQEQYADALDQLRDHATATIPGFDAVDAANKAQEEYEKAIKNAKRALEEGIISQEQAQEAERVASERLAAAKDKAADALNKDMDDLAKERENDKKSTRSKLGVDRLMDEMKSPVEKFNEKMSDIAKAYKDGFISVQEAQVLQQDAASKYYEALYGAADQLDKTASAFAASAPKAKAGETAASLSGGSEALYLAMVKNSTNSYQNQMTAATDRLASNSDESLYYSRESYQYLQTIADALNSNGGSVWS